MALRKAKPHAQVAVGGNGADCGCGTPDDGICWHQRLPVNVTIPAAQVNPSTGEILTPGQNDYEITHRGDYFHARKLLLAAEKELADGTVVPASKAYLREREVNIRRQDCMTKDEPLGIRANFFSSEGCCDGLPVCIEKFANEDEKDSLTLTFVNTEVRLVPGVAEAPDTYIGVPVEIAGYLTGRCVDCGYEKACVVA